MNNFQYNRTASGRNSCLISKPLINYNNSILGKTS